MGVFRQQRVTEPLEVYFNHFDDYQGVVEELLESTVDLRLLREQAADFLTDKKGLFVMRYLLGPPISDADLAVLAEAMLSRKQLRADSAMVGRIVQVIMDGLDRRRFPWVMEGREATAPEREAAILATAALIAMRRAETSRRNESKNDQETLVDETLLSIGLKKVPTRPVNTMSTAPTGGEFCRETSLAGRKADFIIGLYDGRVMPLECKVSNSFLNSIKRLNNDTAIKAQTWIADFGRRHVVPAAVLSGVYKLPQLIDAQARGLTLFWAHDLQPMTDWILQTRRP
jgi:hypothetical protein